MSREEDNYMKVFGQNLFELAPDPDHEYDWEIVTSKGTVFYKVHGKESYARLVAETFGGTYRRIGGQPKL